MHPDNNPLDLAAGQFFLKGQDGQTIPLGIGTVENTSLEPGKDEQGEPQPVRCINKDMPPLTIEMELTPEGEAHLRVLAEAYTAWLQQIVDVQYAACIKWAKEHRKKWLHIGRTTKKSRIRKKYARLIWRDYKAAQVAALARIAGEV